MLSAILLYGVIGLVGGSMFVVAVLDFVRQRERAEISAVKSRAFQCPRAAFLIPELSAASKVRSGIAPGLLPPMAAVRHSSGSCCHEG